MESLRSVGHGLGILNRLRGLPASGFDLEGEKVLDWSWCLSHLPHSPGQEILDIGCAQAPILPAAVMMGHEVTGVDTDRLPYELPGLKFCQADFLDCDLGRARFDAVILCSVVEHVGLAGRYAQRSIPDGDLRAMRKVATLLKPDGILILAIPVGRDLVFAPWHRIYGADRLPRLLDGFIIEKERFFIKEPGSSWHPADRAEALQIDRDGISYALGQFLLKTQGG